jgi:hypothetical protein
MKKKVLTTDDLYNGWLVKYHGITVQELLEKEPELCKTSEWYKKYAVTTEQYDEWYKWAIKEIQKFYHCSKKTAIRNFAFDYLNVSPSIKDEPDN